MPFAAKGLVIMSGSGQGGGFIEAFDALTGQIEVVLELDSEARRAGQRNLGRRLVEKRRRPDLGERQLRSAAQPDLLGHRAADARLRRRQPRRRQPLHRQHRRARHRHRQDEVAFPEHAARRARLGLERDAGSASTRRSTVSMRKLLLQANRNGIYYVLDRTNGKFLRGVPFVSKVDWMSGLSPEGRPILTPGHEPTVQGIEDVPVDRGRDQLAVARVQPRHEAVLSDRAGRLRHHLPLDDEFPARTGRQRYGVHGEPGRSRALAALRARASTR